jgi:beta-lactamase superfamily II metal-dependent hydrolase
MFRFILFDVGHGFCAYATTPGTGNMLFDCGYDTDLEFYPHRYLSDRKITYVSTLFLSHFDQDHVDNLPAIRRVANFGSIYRNGSIPVDFIRREKQRNGHVTPAMESALDMHGDWTAPVLTRPDYGGVKVTTFCNPYPTFTDMNNLSLVTFLHYDGCGIVIPGDLEREGWELLLKGAAFRQCLTETNVFIASHHGRNAGYCEEVFNHCDPYIVLLSDKNIVHDSQDHDYLKHSSGVVFPDGPRYVLTTRTDGHIMIEKQKGERTLITTNVEL